MGTIAITEFVSLDGVMEDPGGAEGYKHGGWTFKFDRGAEGDQFKLDEAVHASCMLLGRVTYEGFAAAWPTMENQFADRFNSMPKYVLSSTLTEATWTNSTILSGDLVEEVTALRDATDGEVMVQGSRQLVQGLLAHHLVDEMRLMVFPVLLGKGKRLFAETDADKTTFRLAESSYVGDGVGILTYRKIG